MKENNNISKSDLKKVLKDIMLDLETKGYNPTKQITNYLMTGDPGYISNFKECRSRIKEIDRSKILEMMLEDL